MRTTVTIEQGAVEIDLPEDSSEIEIRLPHTECTLTPDEAAAVAAALNVTAGAAGEWKMRANVCAVGSAVRGMDRALEIERNRGRGY